MLEKDESNPAVEEEAYLLGIPTLSEYVRYVRRRTVDGQAHEDSELLAQWCAADDHYQVLESLEPNLPDDIQVTALPDSMAPLVERVLQDRYFTRCFEASQMAFAMVELDKVMVIQEHITLSHAQRICTKLGPSPDDELLFRTCLPYERSEAPVSVLQDGTHSFIFQSDSMDLRAFRPEILPAEVRDTVPANGPPASVIGLCVGFGPNYLTGIRIGKRIVLNNGYHRAYALRSLGITHVPMAIQVISRPDELALTGGDVKSDSTLR